MAIGSGIFLTAPQAIIEPWTDGPGTVASEPGVGGISGKAQFQNNATPPLLSFAKKTNPRKQVLCEGGPPPLFEILRSVNWGVLYLVSKTGPPIFVRGGYFIFERKSNFDWQWIDQWYASPIDSGTFGRVALLMWPSDWGRSSPLPTRARKTEYLRIIRLEHATGLTARSLDDGCRRIYGHALLLRPQ